MEPKQIDILDILLILAKHKKFIIITTLIVSIFAVVYSLLVPQYWKSTATILPQSTNQGFSFSGSSILGLGSSLLGASPSESSDFITIMNSRTFAEDVIKKFDLIKYFKIKDKDSLVVMEGAIKKLNRKVKKITLNEDNGLISINIETKDKYLSARIANYYWQKLEQYNIQTRMSKGKRQRIFLEKRLREVRQKLDSLSLQINEFQKEHNAINIEEQTKLLISTYAELQAEKTAAEIELEYQKNYLGKNSPIIVGLEHKINILEKKIKELEFTKEDSQSDFILNIKEIPDLSLQYAKLLSKLQIQQKIYEFLYPQFEQAKIEEQKDLPTIEIIDKAVPAGMRSKPKRARLCIISFFLAIFTSSLIEIFIHLLNQEQKQKIKQIKYKLFI